MSTQEPDELPHPGPPPPKRVSPQPPRTGGDGKTVPMLQDRLEMYTEAKECARAKGDNSKARRMDRGIKVRYFPKDFFPSPEDGIRSNCICFHPG